MNQWHWGSFLLYLSVFSFPLFIFSSTKTENNNYERKYKSVNISRIIISLIPAIALLAFRSQETGTDLINYRKSFFVLEHVSFQDILTFRRTGGSEPLFDIFRKIIGDLFNWNFDAFIFFSAILTFTFFVLIFQKLSKYNINLNIAILTMFALYYIRIFSMVRQGIALSISLYALIFLEEKKYNKFFFLTFLAIGFHYTAIINFLFYFWAKIKDSKVISKVLLLGTAFIITIFGDVFLTTFFNIISDSYDLNLSSNFGIGNTLIRLPILLFLILVRKDLIKENQKADFFIHIYLLDIMVSQLKYINVRFERLTMYTMLPLIFIIPVTYNVLRKKINFLISILVYILLFIIFIWSIVNYTYINPYQIMPYRI